MWNRLWVAMQWFMVTFVAAACWADGGIRGPYLGQPSPGLEAQVFAPGIISDNIRTENNITFTPDGVDGGEPVTVGSIVSPALASD
jgi:hypothetical protein